MKEYKEQYKNLVIFLNNYGEYCVCSPMSGQMVSYNAGFTTPQDAKSFIDDINPNMTKEQIEKIAKNYKDNF